MKNLYRSMLVLGALASTTTFASENPIDSKVGSMAKEEKGKAEIVYRIKNKSDTSVDLEYWSNRSTTQLPKETLLPLEETAFGTQGSRWISSFVSVKDSSSENVTVGAIQGYSHAHEITYINWGRDVDLAHDYGEVVHWVGEGKTIPQQATVDFGYSKIGIINAYHEGGKDIVEVCVSERNNQTVCYQ